MDVLEAIRTRRSVGRLDGEVDDADLRAMLDAALWAPNHKLTEAWQFVVLRGAARERLGVVWAELVARDMPQADPQASGDPREAVLRKEAQKPLRAPVLVVVGVRVTPGDAMRSDEDYAAASAATQNLLLAAHALGYGAIWRTGEMAFRSEIAAHLGFASDERIVAFVYVGRRAMDAPAPQPRSYERAVRFLA